MTIENDFIITPESFCRQVEDAIWHLDCSYMEAVIHVAELRGIEMDQASRLLNRSIKEKIEREAQDLNFLERPNRLPL